MTAEAIARVEDLEQQTVILELVSDLAVQDEQQAPSDSSEEESTVGANAAQRSVLRAVYGGDPVKSIDCLTSDEANLLLNQAARLHLQFTPEPQKEAAVHGLGIVRDFIHGMDLDQIAAKRNCSRATIARAKSHMYTALQRAVRTEVTAGRSVTSPRNLIEQKIAPAEEQVAALNTADVSDPLQLGLCGYVQPEVFDVAKKDTVGVRVAKLVCARCTVREECLEDAALNGFKGTIMAGLTALEFKRRKN